VARLGECCETLLKHEVAEAEYRGTLGGQGAEILQNPERVPVNKVLLKDSLE